MKYILILFLGNLLFFHSNATYGNVIYVDVNATGLGDGSSWGNAFIDLNQALQIDNDDDTIKVAQGTYYPTTFDRTTYFYVNKKIVILGGYDASTGIRHYAYNKTIFSGDFQSDGIKTNNSKTILLIASSASALIDGVVFEGGYADGSSIVERTGAALINYGNCSLINCIFRKNEATGAGPLFDSGVGGAIFSNTSESINVVNSLFYENMATGNGAAISTDHGAANFMNTTFYNNISPKGAYSYYQGIPVISNCIFAGNLSGKDINKDGPQILTIKNSILENDVSLPTGSIDNGGNQLNIDPLLLNPAGFDFSLSSSSPAIDAGSNSVVSFFQKDLKEVNRILNGTVDIGAFEYCVPSTNTLNVSLCNSLTYQSPSGKYVWATPGTYTDTIPNYVGCDSIITINLTINANAQTDTTIVNDCYAVTSPSGNYTWTNSGFYHDTVTNINGCDSVLNFNVTILAPRDTIDIDACSYYTAPSGNYTWTSNGIYSDTLYNPSGCDTILTINLNLNSTTATFDKDACYSFNSPSLNYTWTSSGTYYDTIPNSVGCDSIMIFNLRVFEDEPAKVIYVDSSVAVSGDGTSWFSAYKTIQQALDSTNGCFQSIDTVKVAKGTYYPPDPSNDSLPIRMKHRCVMLGGFDASTGERDYKLYPTILSGDIQQDNEINNNSKTILKIEEGYSIIDGFIIENGFANGDYCICDLEDFSGAGIFTSYDLTVKNCVFRNNHATSSNGYGIGAALYASYTSDSMRVINCTFYNNTSTGNGGAVTFDQAPGIVNNCVFFNNISPNGALHVWANEVTVNNSIFFNNNGSNISNNPLDSVKVYNSLFDGGLPLAVTDKGGNITFSNPLFANPGVGDFNLTLGSPAINAGKNNVVYSSLDAKYEPRIMGNIIDIGVSEYCNNVSTVDNQTTLLSSDANFVDYQWVDCDSNFLPVAGANSKVFVPTTSGNYAVVVDNGVCSDTSECQYFEMNTSGISSHTLENQIAIYPNPTEETVYIEFDKAVGKGSVTLVDLAGNELQKLEIENTLKVAIKMNVPNGMYLLKINQNNGRVLIKKIVKR